MEIKNLKKQKGFTLVEIAIVLVIIGLLLGGVLKGQELITNAKIKAVTSDFDGISSAYYAYQDRTGNVAGDDVVGGATRDGVINSDDNFWLDVRTEGFISGAAVVLGTPNVGPTHDLDGVWLARPGASAAMFTTNHICATNILNTYAQGMDTKMDDGDPSTGTIRGGAQTTVAVGATSSATAADAVTTGAYLTAEGTLYTVCKEL